METIVNMIIIVTCALLVSSGIVSMMDWFRTYGICQKSTKAGYPGKMIHGALIRSIVSFGLAYLLFYIYFAT